MFLGEEINKKYKITESEISEKELKFFSWNFERYFDNIYFDYYKNGGDFLYIKTLKNNKTNSKIFYINYTKINEKLSVINNIYENTKIRKDIRDIIEYIYKEIFNNNKFNDMIIVPVREDYLINEFINNNLSSRYISKKLFRKVLKSNIKNSADFNIIEVKNNFDEFKIHFNEFSKKYLFNKIFSYRNEVGKYLYDKIYNNYVKYVFENKPSKFKTILIIYKNSPIFYCVYDIIEDNIDFKLLIPYLNSKNITEKINNIDYERAIINILDYENKTGFFINILYDIFGYENNPIIHSLVNSMDVRSLKSSIKLVYI